MSKSLLTEWNTSPDYTMTAVQCRLTISGGELPAGTGHIDQSQDGHLIFFNDKAAFAIQIVNAREQRRLEDFLVRNFINRASVMDLQETAGLPAPEEAGGRGTFFLHIVFFVKEVIRTELPIVCGEGVMRALERRGLEKLDVFKKQLEWPTDGSNRYVCLVYAEGEDFRDIWSEAKADPADARDEVAGGPEQQAPEADGAKPVRRVTFFGRKFQLSVEICQSDAYPGQEIWFAQELKTNQRFLPCMRLLSVARFSLTTQRKWSAATVGSFLQKEGTYLSTWQHYADMEGEILLDRLQRIGRMHYSILPIRDADGYLTATVVAEAENLDLIEVDDRLFSMKEIEARPAYMTDGEMEWSDYETYVKKLQKDGMGERFEIKRIDYQQGKLWLKPLDSVQEALEHGKYGKDCRLYLDDYKYRKQIERRIKARQAIQDGNSANPQLGLIIGGDETSAGLSLSLRATGSHKSVMRERIAPFSYSTKKELEEAHREPTPTQKEAITLALNTPDIAIIQGPPGTGKTTVITAILKRLNEVLSKENLARGRVLVTSLQHDAVSNVINRVEINSLPIIKFGTRHHAEGEPGETAADEVVRRWCDALKERLLARHPKITESAASHRLTEAYRFYALKPTAQNAADFLAVARSVTIEADLLVRIHNLEERYKPIRSTEDTDLSAAIRRLWSSPRAFADGGSARAAELLALLDDVLDAADPSAPDTEDGFIRATLGAAGSWARLYGEEPLSDDLRHDLRRCRQLLLARCIPRPRYQVAKLDGDIIELYEDIKQALDKPEGEADNILYTLLSQLEYNQDGIKESLKNYMFAYAATAQQSVSKDLEKVKGDDRFRYNTVIVDEAARVNPGDLMIPLSQAERRIILVGDHRQLPHMYDEEVFERLLEKGTEFRHSDIQQSMFENLLERARQLEQKDGIKRFITLDVQYRMHPLLGKFISDNFYAKHDRAEAFRSGLPAEHFTQPFASQPLLWIDVPVRTAADREQRQNPSWIRRRECEVIIKTIYSMMDKMPEDHPLSIGVISFYSSQVSLLRKMIKQQGWTEEQIKVGTVDAYQGMEYDIIFLSIVRATLEPGKIDWKAVADPQAKQHDRIGRRHYGFLTSENRLCVALSRQKRLLVVVGNAALFSGEYGSRLASAYVPALGEFYRLCEQKGAVIHG